MALIGWWPLDGNTEDYTVNQNHGVNNGVTWVDGKIGQAASILNSGKKITIPSVSGNILTYAVWHKWDTTSKTWRTIFGNNGNIHHLIFNNNRSVNIWDGAQRSFGYSCPDDNWHHYLVILENASNAKLYVDGEYKGQTTTTLDTFKHPIQVIGNWGSNSYPVGYLNDVRIYDHALSQKEINDLAKAKVLHYTFNKDEDVIYDGSGYKRNGGKVGTPVISTDKVLGSSSMLVGLGNNAISFPSNHNLNLREAITINIWLKRTTDFNQNQDMFLVSRNPSWYFYDSYASGAIRGDVFIDSIRQGGVTTSLPFDGNWYMITYTYDSNLRKSSIYKNGVLDNQKTLSGLSNYLIDASIANFATCGSATLGRGMLIDDVQIYATALSESDILDLYQTRIKIDNQGNLYTNEIVEDYEVKPGLTLRELFEDNNRFLNFDFSNALPNPLPGTVINDGYATRAYITGNNHSNTTPLTTIETDRKYFLAFKYRPKDEFFSHLNLFLYNLNPARSQQLGSYYASTFQIGKFREFSFYITANNVYDRIYFKNFATGINVGAGVDFDDIFFIPTTDIFGTGNEPSQAQMEIWYKDYITSRPKSSGIVKTREFSEIDSPEQPLKILKDKIQIQGSIKEV